MFINLRGSFAANESNYHKHGLFWSTVQERDAKHYSKRIPYITGKIRWYYVVCFSFESSE